MTGMVVKIIVELLSTVLATKHIKQGRLKKFGKKRLGENGVQAALQRLIRLTQDEARETATQTLEIIYHLVQNMKTVMYVNRKASNDSVRRVLEMMQQITSEANKTKRDQIQRDLRRWLSPPDPWKNHNIACDAHHDGTAEWFIESDTFVEWKYLSVVGTHVIGKFYCMVIKNIEGMCKSGSASLAFFIVTSETTKRKTAEACYLPFFPNIVCLKDILEYPGQAPICVIVDALDECPNTSSTPSPREKVLSVVAELVGLRLPNLRICITSRPETDIDAVLDPLMSHSFSLHDEDGQN
ncbi:hypothetical protein BJV78DRAFT_1363940 [Lactifluus subvellereus]|nr:hypothetical protein BJV78DRAFT_1363940 [Lactifluus subvellereus]